MNHFMEDTTYAVKIAVVTKDSLNKNLTNRLQQNGSEFLYTAIQVGVYKMSCKITIEQSFNKVEWFCCIILLRNYSIHTCYYTCVITVFQISVTMQKHLGSNRKNYFQMIFNPYRTIANIFGRKATTKLFNFLRKNYSPTEFFDKYDF